MSRIVLAVDVRRPGQEVNLDLLLRLLARPLNEAGHSVRALPCTPLAKEEWIEAFDDHQSWRAEIDGDELVVGFEMPPVAQRRYGDRLVDLRRHPLRFTGSWQIKAATPVQSVLAPFLQPVIPRPTARPVRRNALFACQVRDDSALQASNGLLVPEMLEMRLQGEFQQYDRVFVRPHPEDMDSPWVEAAMSQPNAELQAGGNAYAAVESAERVIALSSSLLAEAPYFGAQATPLYRAPDTRNRIALETLLKPEFWQKVLP